MYDMFFDRITQKTFIRWRGSLLTWNKCIFFLESFQHSITCSFGISFCKKTKLIFIFRWRNHTQNIQMINNIMKVIINISIHGCNIKSNTRSNVRALFLICQLQDGSNVTLDTITIAIIHKTQSSCCDLSKNKIHFPLLKSDVSISFVVFPYVVKVFKIHLSLNFPLSQ